MLKHIFGLLLVCALHTVNAQVIQNYGLKVGVTNSQEKWYYNEGYELKTDARWGTNISAFAEFLDMPFLRLVAEMGYNQKGMDWQGEISSPDKQNSANKRYKNRVDYLELGLALKIYYEQPTFSPYLLAGPQLALFLGHTAAPGFKTIYDDYKKTVRFVNLAIGSEIKNLLPVTVLLEIRFNQDLSDLYKSTLLTINDNSYEVKIGVVF